MKQTIINLYIIPYNKKRLVNNVLNMITHRRDTSMVLSKHEAGCNCHHLPHFARVVRRALMWEEGANERSEVDTLFWDWEGNWSWNYLKVSDGWLSPPSSALSSVGGGGGGGPESGVWLALRVEVLFVCLGVSLDLCRGPKQTLHTCLTMNQLMR